MTSTASTTAVSGKKKNYRRKHSSIEEEGSGPDSQNPQQNEGDSSLHQKLELTKHLQRLRARSNGLNAGVGTDLGALSNTEVIETPHGSLDETFTSQSDGPEINRHMEKYIEDQLAKKKDNKPKGDSEEKVEDAELYTTPEHLKTIPQRRIEESNWLTGIVEVQLPIEYKIKNIEETEKAKREMLQNKANNETRISNFGTENNKKGLQRASDDTVMERFKKRFR